MSQAPHSFKVAATLAAYRIVKASAANTVNYATAATDALLGVTTDDVKNLNEAIPVQTWGLAKVTFNDSCAVGAFVTADANGFAVPAVLTTAGVQVLGQLVGPAVAASGTIAEVMIQPHQRQSQ